MKETLSLNGLWHFMESRFGNCKRTVRDWRPVHVPACWETYAPGLEGYEGVGWYSKTFVPPAGKRWLLRFEAVNYRCEVTLNGKLVGTHEGGYTPFEFDISESVLPGVENELGVKVDNSRHRMLVPAPYHGWANYGGIHRDVSVVGYEEALIGNAQIVAKPSAIEDGACAYADISVKPEIIGGSEDVRFDVSVFVDGSDTPVFEAVDQRLPDCSFHLPRPRLWSCDAPCLYRLELVLPGVDRKSFTFGVREIVFGGEGLFLNGEKIFLRGINRHDDYPTAKRSVDEDILNLDFQLLKELNVNALRLAHYPHDRRVVELCDRHGMLVWDEIPVYWEVPVENDASLPVALAMAESMVKRDWNSPSVIFWGLYNEIPSHKPEYAAFVKALGDKIRSLDSGRLLAGATYPLANKDLEDLGPEHLDITGINIYPAWYQTQGVELRQVGLDFSVGRLDLAHFDAQLELVERRLGMPFILSEFGAEGILGYRAKDMPKYSEEYQAHATAAQFEVIGRHPAVVGAFLWLFADFPDPSREDSCFNLDRNCKGVVDYGRRKKLAFETLKGIYAGLKG